MDKVCSCLEDQSQDGVSVPTQCDSLRGFPIVDNPVSQSMRRKPKSYMDLGCDHGPLALSVEERGPYVTATYHPRRDDIDSDPRYDVRAIHELPLEQMAVKCWEEETKKGSSIP